MYNSLSTALELIISLCYIEGTSGRVHFDGNGDKQPAFWVEDLKNSTDDTRLVGIIETYNEDSKVGRTFT